MYTPVHIIRILCTLRPLIQLEHDNRKSPHNVFYLYIQCTIMNAYPVYISIMKGILLCVHKKDHFQIHTNRKHTQRLHEYAWQWGATYFT